MTRRGRIVITREARQSLPWVERLRGAGLKASSLPLIDYEAIDPAEPVDPREFDWLLFTSPQGVRRYAELFPLAPGSTRVPRQVALAAGTAAALAALGGRDELGLDCRDGAEFAVAFRERVDPPAALLLPGAERRLPEPAATLAAAGFSLRELPIYRTRPLPPAALPKRPCGSGDVVFFASPSAVRAFRAAWPELSVTCAVIGETTAVTAREAGLDPAVAATPSLAGLCLAAGIDFAEPSEPASELNEPANERKRHG